MSSRTQLSEDKIETLRKQLLFASVRLQMLSRFLALDSNGDGMLSIKEISPGAQRPFEVVAQVMVLRPQA